MAVAAMVVVRSYVGSLIAASLLLAGCGDVGSSADAGEPDGAGLDAGRSDAGEPDAGPNAAAEEFLRAYRLARCDHALRCEHRAHGEGLALERDCHSMYVDDWERDVRRALSRATTRFDATAARTCFETIASTTQCEGSGLLDWFFDPWAVCERVFVGTVAPGDACHVDDGARGSSIECRPDSRCVFGAECPGACVPFATEGMACGSYADCAAPFECVYWQCGTRRGAGEPCATDFDCTSDLHCPAGTCEPRPDLGELCDARVGCVFPNACVAGWCEAPRPPGAPCTSSAVCEGSWPICADDGTCHDLSLSGEGDPCLPPVSGYRLRVKDTCPDDRVCVAASGAMFGRCVTGGAPGSACSDTAPCGVWARCVDGTCRAIVGDGASCDASHVCPLTHDCVRDACMERGRPGDRCGASARCARGACLGGLCTVLVEGERCLDAVDAPFEVCEGRCSDDFDGTCSATLGLDASCPRDASPDLCDNGLECSSRPPRSPRCLPVCAP